MIDKVKTRLTGLYISNYKNLKDCHFDVGDISVLVGSNNSGKSNFFEIFSILNKLFHRGEEGEKEIAQLIFSTNREHIPTKPLVIKIFFSTEKNGQPINVTYHLELSLQKDNKDKLAINHEELFFKQPDVPGPSVTIFKKEEERLKIRDKVGDSKLKSFKIPLNSISFELIRLIITDEETIKNEYLPLLFIRKLARTPLFKAHDLNFSYKAAIREKLQPLYELQEKKDANLLKFKASFIRILNLDDINFGKLTYPEKENEIYYYCLIKERGIDEPRFIYDLSDGSRLLFLMLYELFISNFGQVVIDEPEIGLHPNALASLLDTMKKDVERKQVLIATHSPFLLNLVDFSCVTVAEKVAGGMVSFKPASKINNIKKRLRGKYIDFGDLFADNFNTEIDTSL
ncbi:MAG: AAA family ATPase [Pseudomonadota bacterium]